MLVQVGHHVSPRDAAFLHSMIATPDGTEGQTLRRLESTNIRPLRLPLIGKGQTIIRSSPRRASKARLHVGRRFQLNAWSLPCVNHSSVLVVLR